MKRLWILAGCSILLIAGCELKRVLFWSPDGQRAAVIATDGLHLCNAAGKLSEVIAKDVSLVAWFPDSRGFVAVRVEKAKKWEEAQSVLSRERREKLLGLADRLHTEALAFTGKWDDFKPSFASEISDGEMAALILYLRDHHKEGLREKIGEKWNDVEAMTSDICVLQRFEVSDQGVRAGAVFARTLDAIGEVRVSPKHTALACVQSLKGGNSGPLLRLSVLPMSGGVLREAAISVAMYPDWSADGQSLYYATTKTNSSESEVLPLGVITSRTVCSEAGAVLDKFGDASDKVGILFWPMTKIRCLRDGQVLFSGMDVSLPAGTADMPQHGTLFSIDPGRRATVARVLPRDSEINSSDAWMSGTFEMSPDQKRILVCSAKDNAAKNSILTLATGDVQEVALEKQAKDDSPVDVRKAVEAKGMAEWRTSEELAVVVPPRSNWGSKDRYEYALWSGPDKAKCLSCGWPTLFEDQQVNPASSPASQAAGQQ